MEQRPGGEVEEGRGEEREESFGQLEEAHQRHAHASEDQEEISWT